MATEPNPEPAAEERLNRPVRGEYFTGDEEQPRQYCVWECVDTPHASRPRGRVPKPSCGSLCVTYTAKHWGHHDWQGVCSVCGKKPRLNAGRILASYTLEHDAKMHIHRIHSRRRFVEIYMRFWKAHFHSSTEEFEQFVKDNKGDLEMLMMLWAQCDLEGYQHLMHMTEKERYKKMFGYDRWSHLYAENQHLSCLGNVLPLKKSLWRV
jgi:hypothetical protein